MEARSLKLVWLVPALALAVLPVADAASRGSRSSHSSSGSHSKSHPHGRPGDVVDHIQPLECGGADAPSNLQWQTIAESKAKDRTERNCR